MTCRRVGKAIVCFADCEDVTMATGRKLTLEWHPYCGPSVETRKGVRPLTNKEFDDPHIKAWIDKRHTAQVST